MKNTKIAHFLLIMKTNSRCRAKYKTAKNSKTFIHGLLTQEYRKSIAHTAVVAIVFKPFFLLLIP